ncbi:MAG TPA: SCO family protein [Chthoniobacterales bacterium]|nr:SCO family protein [Chthoniobacterales bacterium]
MPGFTGLLINVVVQRMSALLGCLLWAMFFAPGAGSAASPDDKPSKVANDEAIRPKKPGLETSVSPGTPDVPAPSLSTIWIPAAQRSQVRSLDIAFKNQDGEPGLLSDLINQPVLITFFYTRCQNNRKCSAAVGRLAALQRQLRQAGLEDRVRLLAITYEPQFDSPERINRYGTDHGLQFGRHAMALQLDIKRQQRLIDELQAPVSFNAGWVNSHGVELSLLDAKGRLVRQYHTLLWDNDQVAGDLQRVIPEE